MLLKRTGTKYDWVDGVFVANEILEQQAKNNVKPDYELYILAHTVKMRMGQVESIASSIKNRTEHILKQIELAKSEGQHVGLNSLGELQSQGPGFDVAIAVYETVKELLERYLLEHYSEVVEN